MDRGRNVQEKSFHGSNGRKMQRIGCLEGFEIEFERERKRLGRKVGDEVHPPFAGSVNMPDPIWYEQRYERGRLYHAHLTLKSLWSRFHTPSIVLDNFELEHAEVVRARVRSRVLVPCFVVFPKLSWLWGIASVWARVRARSPVTWSVSKNWPFCNSYQRSGTSQGTSAHAHTFVRLRRWDLLYLPLMKRYELEYERLHSYSTLSIALVMWCFSLTPRYDLRYEQMRSYSYPSPALFPLNFGSYSSLFFSSSKFFFPSTFFCNT